MNPTSWAAFCGFLAAVLLVAACGGDDDEQIESPPTVTVVQDTAPAPTPELQPQPAPPQALDETASPAVDGIIAIEATNTLFAPNRWSMALGETALIRVINDDQQQHNLRIAGLDGAFESDDDALTVPDAIAAGETGELTFVPLVPGQFTFRCDYHPSAMGGQIEVAGEAP
jgi:plastocyanin